MIEMLPDDILLNIFRHCLGTTPRFWPTLTCVCQRWRQIVHTSPLGLNLHLYCTHGTPVLKSLDCWLALPIILHYGGVPNLDPPALEDDNNIIAALRQSGRVTSIGLTITSSLLEKLSAISEPFLELEDLALISQDNMNPNLLGAFRWGPRLRTLHLTGVALSSFPQLLLLSRDLVDLQLYEIPRAGYFSPEAFASALFGMTQLKTLSLHFLSLPPRRNYLGLPPVLGERSILPVLRSLKYRGTSKYLDTLVARIDAPSLEEIDIGFFGQPTIDAVELGRFIERIEVQTFHSRADIKTSAHAISISLSHSNASSHLRLQISCQQLDWQWSYMIQVCNQFAPLLSPVQDLGIDTTQSSKHDDVGGEQWLELVRSFGGVRNCWFAGEPMADFLYALNKVNSNGRHTTDTIVLPTLRNLRVKKTRSINASFWVAAQYFVLSRRLIGHPMDLQILCHICDTGFTERESLNKHLVDMHKYRIVCLHCGDFEYRSERSFRKHLKRKHFEVMLISNSHSPHLLLQLPDVLVNHHDSPSRCASNLVAPSTAVIAQHSQ